MVHPSSKAKATIICCNGYQANKADFCLTFGRHGEKSGGRIVTFGITELRDILGAINYLKSRDNTSFLPIGIWGYSIASIGKRYI